MTQTETGGLYAWHVHHDRLVEPLTEPMETRIAYIKQNKPAREVEVRLRLFKLVQDQAAVKPLYDEYLAKRKTLYDEYLAKRKPLDDEYDAKWKPLYDEYLAKRKTLYDEYLAKRKPLYDEYLAKREPLESKMLKLHAEECPDCPWNGETILVEVPRR